MITRIEKEATYDKRYRIYVDDRPLFSIHEDVLVKFHIHKGMIVDSAQLQQLYEEEERNRVRQVTYQYLAFKQRTVFEVRQHLLQKKADEKHIEVIIDEMIRKGYLNDRQYALQWIKDKKKLKGWGYFRLKQELERKGVASNWIEEALGENPQDDSDMAREKAQKRYKRLCHEPWVKVKRKIGTYLLREGFSHDITYTILNELRLTHRESEK